MPSNRNCRLFLQYVGKLFLKYVGKLLHFLKRLLGMENIQAAEDAAAAANSAELGLQSRNQAQQQPGGDVETSPAAEEEASIKTGLKIAIPVTLTAAAGLISVLAGFIGNKSTGRTHVLFFVASIQLINLLYCQEAHTNLEIETLMGFYGVNTPLKIEDFNSVTPFGAALGNLQ
ncbi:hypothetical protein ACLOJK_035088 [Asimina triloba]